MSTNNATVFDRRFLAFFSILAFLIVMGYLFMVTFVPVSTGGAKYADMIVPLLLGTVIGGLFGYFFGASKNNTPEGGASNVIPFPTAPISTTVTSTGATGGEDGASKTATVKGDAT